MGQSHPTSGRLFLNQEQKMQAAQIKTMISFIEDYISKNYNTDLKTLIEGTEEQKELLVCSVYNLYEESFKKWDPVALQVGGSKFFSYNTIKKRHIGKNLGSLQVSENSVEKPEYIPVVTRKTLCHDIIRYVIEKIKFLNQITEEYAKSMEGCLLTTEEIKKINPSVGNSKLLPSESAEGGEIKEQPLNGQQISYQEYYNNFKTVVEKNNNNKKILKTRAANAPPPEGVAIIMSPEDEKKASKQFNSILDIQESWNKMLLSMLEEMKKEPELTMVRLEEMKSKFDEMRTYLVNKCTIAISGLRPLEGISFKDGHFIDQSGRVVNEFKFP